MEMEILSAKEMKTSCKLIIPGNIYSKVMAWIRNCKDECGGYMSIARSGEAEYTVLEAFLPRQVVSGAYLRLEDSDCNKIKSALTREQQTFFSEQVALVENQEFKMNHLFGLQSKIKAIKEKNGTLKCQWHSHVNMGTQKSGTDDSTGKRLSENMDFALMLILNKREEFNLYAFVREPVPTIANGEVEIIINEEEVEYSDEEAINDLEINIFSRDTHLVNQAGNIEEREIDEISKRPISKYPKKTTVEQVADAEKC